MGCLRSCADFSPGDLGLVDGLNPAVVGGSGGVGVSSPSTSPKCTGTRALHPPTPAPASPSWLHRGAQRAGAGPFPYKGRFFWRPIWCGESNPRSAVSKVQRFCTHFHFPPRTRTEGRPWGAPSRRPQQLRACVVVPWGCWRHFGVGTGWARDLLCPTGALGVPSTPGSKQQSQTVIIPMGDPAAGAGMGEHPFAAPFSPLFSCRSRNPSGGSDPSTWAAWPSPRPYFIWGGDGELRWI